MLSEGIAIVSTEDQGGLLPEASRPWPNGVRDLGDRHYEAVTEWSDTRGEAFTADQHAALQAQAVTEAESRISDELGQAEAAINQSFGVTDAYVGADIWRCYGQTRIEYRAFARLGDREVSGKGATVWEAVDDLRACAAAELPVAGRVA